MKPKKRIAVLYSGQIRTWRTALQNSKRYYESIHDAEVDYFCHTWDTNEEVQSLGQQGSIETVPVTDDDVANIKSILSPKVFQMEPTPSDPVFGDRWMNLFYSFTKTVNAMKKYAMENDIEYDLVIKSRYDVVHNPIREMPYKLVCMKDTPFMLTSHCHLMPVENFSFNFNDVVFYGTMYTMDVLGNLFFKRYDHINKHARGEVCTRVNDFNFWDGPGVSIFKYLTNYNVRTYDLFEVHEYIVREDSPIDPMTSEGFKYYIQQHKAWYLR